MQISHLAERLLAVHAARPDDLFYGAAALGTLFYGADLVRLDDAYRRLELAGLVAEAGEDMSFFGDRKVLYRITPEGLEHAAVGSPAPVTAT